MKALIVDDEPLARLELRRLLKPCGYVDIVGEAGNIDEARERVEALAPKWSSWMCRCRGDRVSTPWNASTISRGSSSPQPTTIMPSKPSM